MRIFLTYYHISKQDTNIIQTIIAGFFFFNFGMYNQETPSGTFSKSLLAQQQQKSQF